jgi:hypothetical protein
VVCYIGGCSGVRVGLWWRDTVGATVGYSGAMVEGYSGGYNGLQWGYGGGIQWGLQWATVPHEIPNASPSKFYFNISVFLLNLTFFRHYRKIVKSCSKLRYAVLSFRPSLCPSVVPMDHLDSHWKNVHEILYWNIFLNS